MPSDAVVRGKSEANGLLSPVRAGIDAGRWSPIPRGYPEGMEILTEYGFIDFRLLFNAEYLGEPVPFVLDKPAVLKTLNGDIEWGQWKCNNNFPRVASVNPYTGDVDFARPVRFSYWNYRGRIVHIKGRSIDFLATMEADIWLKARYVRGWKFIPARRMVEQRRYKTHFFINNKYNENLYGDYVPHTLREANQSEVLEFGYNAEYRGLMKSELRPRFKYPYPIYPEKHTRGRLIKHVYDYYQLDNEGNKVYAALERKEVPAYNLDVPPHHLIIVRRGKTKNNATAIPLGSPCVVGDGIDKSLIRLLALSKGAKISSLDESYSDFRPDYKYLPLEDGLFRNAYAEEYADE